MNSTRRHLRRTALAVSTTLLVAIAATLPATAYGSGGGVQKQGSCTKGAQWKLSADPQSGRIRVRGEVDTGIKGQHWTWRILHNGGVAAHGKAVTKDGGSFTEQRLLINLAGTDSIGWRASNRASGEHCSGGLKY